MASRYINIYNNNPTEGGTDGDVVSTGNDYSNPIYFLLDAEQNESKIIKLAIRTAEGYAARDVSISDLNDENDRFKICKTENGTFADEITFDEVTAVNSIFYIKATSADTEQPQTDRSVKLNFSGILAAV
ncbi:MAG: hypothetical protein IJG80_00245 [Selenomonadaceae bacterium]|nr:hypothetical protein [Selenomonadaceae bacterium]